MNSQENYNRQLERFLKSYKNNGRAINVNFREIVFDLRNADRVTHLIHSYPAKLLMHIPHFFLNNDLLSSNNDVIFDPFCGSGTVLLESLLAERNSLGSDANPLARLIAKVKTTSYDPSRLYSHLIEINKLLEKNSFSSEVIYFENIDYWFLPQTKTELTKVLTAINCIDDKKYRDFFLVCFSNCVKKVSLADPRISVPVRLKPDQYKVGHPLRELTVKKLKDLKRLSVIDKFIEISLNNILRVESFVIDAPKKVASKIISNDCREVPLHSEIVDLIITSPPYAGAQKYIRSSSLNLGWLGVTKTHPIKTLERLNIGREDYLLEEYKNVKLTNIPEADRIINKVYKVNPQRAFIASNYLAEMRDAFTECVRLLKPGGNFVLVAANNQVCGYEFQTQKYLSDILVSLGLNLRLRLIDDIKSYGLMTKRNKTASRITREWILLFEK